jgi:hypothetical protein
MELLGQICVHCPKRGDSHKDSKPFHILRISQYTNGTGYYVKSAARVAVCTMESSMRPQESEELPKRAKLRYLSDILSLSTIVDVLPRPVGALGDLI